MKHEQKTQLSQSRTPSVISVCCFVPLLSAQVPSDKALTKKILKSDGKELHLSHVPVTLNKCREGKTADKQVQLTLHFHGWISLPLQIEYLSASQLLE